MKQLVLAASLLFLAVSPLFAECSMAEKKALEDFDRAWGDASTRGDRAALEQIVAPDFMGMTPGNIVGAKESIDDTVASAEKARGTPQPTVTHDYYIINCTPTTATITHRNSAVFNEDGKSNTSYSRSIHVLEKRNGRWVAVSNAGHPLSDSAQIMYLEHEWNDADLKGDVAWFERNFASNMTSISSRTGKIAGKADELADFKTRKIVMTWAELRDLDVRKEGDTAVVTGVNHVKGKDAEGKPFDRRVSFTDVWVKRDGRWQVLATQGTDVK